MDHIDKAILRLMDLLIFERKINSLSEFYSEIGILRQTVSKIKKGTSHFTVAQIHATCKKYNVNANWIHGTSDKVYNTPDSIRLQVN